MAAKTDSEKIRKQVNFYFSDSNLPYDKFLWNLHSNAEDKWIPLTIIADFKRMKMVTEDISVILNALKEQESEVYEISEDGKNIRRKGEVVEQDHGSRSIHAKGFPLVDAEAQNPGEKLFELQDKADDLFNTHGNVLATRLKKDGKKFKGSMYVEYSSVEEAKKVAELKELDFEGHKIVLTYRPEYHQMKAEQYKNARPGYRRFQFNAFKPHTHNFENNKRKSEHRQNRGNKRGKGNNKEAVKKNEDEKTEDEKKEDEKKGEEKKGEEKKEEKSAEEKTE